MIDFYEHIEDYINDTLSEADLAAFKKQLDQDDELVRAVENFGVVDEALGLLVEEDIRGVIAGLERGEGIKNTSKSLQKTPGYKSYLLWLFFASCLALFAYLYKSLSENNTSSQNDILYASYYSEYMSPEVRGDSNQTPTLTLCNQGHKLMQEEKLSDAKAVFLQSLKVEDNCTDKSQWYLALIYLSEDNRASLDSLLNIIVTDQASPYNARALKLSKEL